MKTVVTTGGVAAGKSCLFQHLQQRLEGAGGFFFSADAAAREVLDLPEVRQRVVEGLNQEGRGDEEAMMLSDSQAFRSWVREKVLFSADKRRFLEGVIHPAVISRLEAAVEAARGAGAKVFVAEVPLHYEIGCVIIADLVIVVAASRSVQVRRMMENRGLDEATANAFLDAQWPVEAKVEKANAVIWNDGDPSALECQALLITNLLNIE